MAEPASIGIEQLQGIISQATLLKAVQRGRIVRLNRACYDTPARYEVDSFPLRYRVEIYKRYPDLRQTHEAKPFVQTIEIDGDAARYFEEYRTLDDRHLPAAKQEEYTNNASILNAFHALLRGNDGMRLKSGGKRMMRGEFWKKAAQALPRIADVYKHSLPENPRRLQAKYNEYQRIGYAALVNGRLGNSNAAKVKNDENRRAIITNLIADPNNLDDEMIARTYNMIAVKMLPEWPKITRFTVAKMREEVSTAVMPLRRGVNAFMNTRAMQVKRRRPTKAMQYWTLDGWDVELYYQAERDGRTTYTNRLTMVVVLDTCCLYPVGYAIGEQENSSLISEALNNAVRHTRELFGAMYRVAQIQSDRFALSKMLPVYEVVGHHVTPARAHNSKSKAIEPYFLHLNKEYCQKFRNWSGYGVQSSKDSQPNVEFLNKCKTAFPDKAGLVEQITKIMETERARLREQYMAMWSQVPEDKRLPLTEERYLDTFGRVTGRRNSMEGSGLNVTIEGTKRCYDCFDVEFRKYMHLPWIVKYDSEDLSRVLAVSEDGSKKFMLEEKYVQPMALSERSEGDAEQLKRVNDYNRELLEWQKKEICEADRLTREIFAHNSRLDNTLGKHLLTDSRGQHKLNKAEGRLIAADKSAVRVKVKVPRKRAEAIEKELGNEEEAATFRRFDIY